MTEDLIGKSITFDMEWTDMSFEAAEDIKVGLMIRFDLEAGMFKVSDELTRDVWGIAARNLKQGEVVKFIPGRNTSDVLVQNVW